MTTPTPPRPPEGTQNPGGAHPPPEAGATPDYLWDRSGAPDPVVQKLESLLAGSALARLEGPQAEPPRASMRELRLAGTPRVRAVWRASRLVPLAAALALAVGAGAWYVRAHRAPTTGWEIASVEGAPRAGSREIKSGGLWGIGTWLETNGSSSASVRVANIGTLEVSPNSRLQIQASTRDQHLVNLEHGSVLATITAPPKLFLVDTKGARATDMGCRYRLTMPPSGPGMLTVELGWVMLEGRAEQKGGRDWEARVPRGTLCRIDPVVGPGTPYSENASSQLVSALVALDASGWGKATPAELANVLALCGSSDGISVWHMLFRVAEGQRGSVYQRLRALVAMPKSAPADADVLRLDPDAMETLWNEVRWQY